MGFIADAFKTKKQKKITEQVNAMLEQKRAMLELKRDAEANVLLQQVKHELKQEKLLAMRQEQKQEELFDRFKVLKQNIRARVVA